MFIFFITISMIWVIILESSFIGWLQSKKETFDAGHIFGFIIISILNIVTLYLLGLHL